MQTSKAAFGILSKNLHYFQRMIPFVMSMLTMVWEGVKNHISELHQRFKLPTTEICRLGKKKTTIKKIGLRCSVNLSHGHILPGSRFLWNLRARLFLGTLSEATRIAKKQGELLPERKGKTGSHKPGENTEPRDNESFRAFPTTDSTQPMPVHCRRTSSHSYKGMYPRMPFSSSEAKENRLPASKGIIFATTMFCTPSFCLYLSLCVHSSRTNSFLMR